MGAATAYARSLDGVTHTFELRENRIVDNETGSEWNVLGQAVSGPLAGKALAPVVAANHLWFSWAAFRPETRILPALTPDLGACVLWSPNCGYECPKYGC